MQCSVCKGKQYLFKKSSKWATIEKCRCSLYCEICNNKGYVAKIKEGYRYLEKCQCKSLDEKIKRYNALKIPKNYAEKRILNFEIERLDKKVRANQKGIINFLKTYIKNFDSDSKGIILYGSNGVGKTHLLTALLSHLVLNFNVTGLYLDFPQWIMENKYLFHSNNEELKEKLHQELKQITSVDILFIDEFAKNRTDFEKDTFEKIFYERYNLRKIIFIATNYEMTDAKKGNFIGNIVSPALFSRLGDFSSFESNLLEGDDYRIN